MDNKRSGMLLWVLMAAAAGGCTTHVSRDISADGVPGEVVFPAMEKAVLKEGTFPNPDSLRLVAAGVTKDQLYDLLGRPHFREGYAGVREWDYIFHFRRGGQVITCQYKVVFDKQYYARSFYWMPATCAGLLSEPAPAPGPAPAPAVTTRRFNLSADTLFAFGRSGPGDIQPSGRAEISRIVNELRSTKGVHHVSVIGHTDPIGSDLSNLALSQRRADTVRQLLTAEGVPAALISSEGRGEAEQVKQCDMSQPRSALVACLLPNRRVEIVADVEG
jgi:OmpA-OmpF porin, OOP family